MHWIDLFSPTSPTFASFCLSIAFGTSWAIQYLFGKPFEHARFQTIDGLRGYLAFFVFIHHASIWYYYLRGYGWQTPPSNLFTHFGQTGVAMFFMITAFLFVTKLLDCRKCGVNWKHIYLSRFFRLVPLYLFAMMVLFLIVALLSGGKLQEPGHKVAAEAFRWLIFTMAGAPDINGVKKTALIMAGVTWSLPYEWFFYFSLPVIARVLGIKSDLPYWAFGLLLATLLVYAWRLDMSIVRCFLGGIVAAFLVRVPALRVFAITPWASLVAMVALLCTVTQFSTIYASGPQLLLSVSFILIASGADMFGILRLNASKTLGEMAYSIYLLHGFFLYVVFNGVLGIEVSRSLSPALHWLVVMTISPVLICASYLTYRLIEKPCMELAKK